MIDFDSLRLGFAFAAGAATFFAPCAFPLLPGYVAYFIGQVGDEGTGEDDPVLARLRRAAVVGLVTSLGFFLVYAALVGVVVGVGTRALTNVSVLELVVGALLVVLGTGMATGTIEPGSLYVTLPERRRSSTGFLLFGIVYAAAAAGCTAPVFLGLAGLALSGGPVAAVGIFGAYAAGMSVLMVGVTVASALGRDALLRRASRSTGRISRVAGALLVVAGVVQIYLFLFEFKGMELLGLA
jgi:cytochrome c-type biogenesis protein